MHIGTHRLSYWDDLEQRQAAAGELAAPYLREQKRPQVATPEIDWASFGFDVRWIGDDPADCLVTLEPGVYHGQGAAEFERFVQSAELRGETAIVISTIAEATKNESRGYRNIFSDTAGSDHLSKWNSYISARYLGERAQVYVSEDIHGADRDLALRLINADLRWWVLELHGSHVSVPGGREVDYPAAGTLTPLIQSGLGETVVGVWVAPNGVERRYLLPSNVDWAVVADWIAEQAIPEFVPAALRRYRSLEHVPGELMTADEIAASAALAAFEREVEERRQILQHSVDASRAGGDQMRHELLFARAGELVDGVAKVLRAAGVEVIDLDQELEGTISADLLCSFGGQSRLVEVKSVGGAASERLYSDLLRHLESWPAIPGTSPINGGALVINHEHKQHPLQRSTTPYYRPEFLAAQREPIVTTRELFDAWREADYRRIRDLIFRTSPDLPTEQGIARPQTPAPKRPVKWWQRKPSV